MADFNWTIKEVRALTLANVSEVYDGDPAYIEAAVRAFDSALAAHDAEVRAATLAPIEALHSIKRTVYLRRDAQGDDHWDEVQFCRGCSADWPCPTAQAIADIKAKAGA